MATLLRDAALLLLGHGSTLNADSSLPTYQHAEEIRRRNIFADVCVAFWKEEPNFRQALRQIKLKRVYVVPNFISSGYFTEQIIPRELGLTGPMTEIDGKQLFYCEPVGLHPSMTNALLHRAKEVVSTSGETIIDPARTACLFICGHGTSLNDNSTKIIHEQAEIIRKKGLYADCQGVLMEQKPFVKDWRTLTHCPDVIVVPFFISDGLHSYEDIPVLLGLTHNVKEKSFSNPHRENDRRLWYSNAIGTEPLMADVIIAQAEKFQADHNIARSLEPVNNASFPALAQFLLGKKAATIGQISIRMEGPMFHFTHVDDAQSPPETLREVDVDALLDIIRTDREGQFRPLRAAPNLLRGWIMNLFGFEAAQAALDYFYPAAIANWSLYQEGKLPITPWQETAERQTGRFRVLRELDEAGVHEVVSHYCERGCLKRRLWSPAAQDVSPAPNEIPLLCPEACNFLVEKARAHLKGTDDE